MKVKELIAKLQDEDQEADALIVTEDNIYLSEIDSIEKSGDFGGVVIRAYSDE